MNIKTIPNLLECDVSMIYKMHTVCFYCYLIWSVWCFLQATASNYVKLSHNGPVVLGGTITFKASLYKENGERPEGTFRYTWKDNSLIQHKYQTEGMSSTITYWNVTYSRKDNFPGRYIVRVFVEYRPLIPIYWLFYASAGIEFEISEYLNGNITIQQSNKTVAGEYISSMTETKLMINMNKEDYNYITHEAMTISTYWFIDCKYYDQTNDFTFTYNFIKPDVTHEIDALVVASYNLSSTTTVLQPTITNTIINVTVAPTFNTTNSNETITTIITESPTIIATTKATIMSTTVSTINTSIINAINMSLSYICSNSSFIPPDPNKIYGYFHKKIFIRAPISNISVEGTNWIQPWDKLFLNVTCKGSGPFSRCLQFYRGKYNVTGNETCDDKDPLQSCDFPVSRYFFEPSVYTLFIILKNDVSIQIYPLTINIYKVTTKPLLSVIIVPVSCTLVAVVLIVFGIAYYIQSRARFTVEVADFDFGQNNPEIEYKTFMERLRDSFNNTGYKQLSNPQILQ